MVKMLVRRPNASIPPIIDRIEIAATFESGLVEIARRWPDACFDVDDFAAWVRDRILVQRDLSAMLPRLRVADLFLTWWAMSSTDGITAFESEVAYELSSIVARFPHVDMALLVEVVRVTLFTGAEDGPRIAEYTGFGSLHDWVDVVVTQICIDAARMLTPRALPIATSRRDVHCSDDEARDGGSSRGGGVWRDEVEAAPR